MALLNVFLRVLAGILLGVLLLPWSLDLLIDTVWHHRHWPQDPVAVVVGALAAIALTLVGRPNWFVHTFIHELCHALLCVLLRVRIRAFNVSDGAGGFVKHDEPDPVRALFILLAPYTVPLLLTPVLVARMWVHQPGAGRVVLSGLCAFLFVTHLVGLWRNVATNFWGKDGDLAKAGRFLALVLILVALALVSVWTVDTLWSR